MTRPTMRFVAMKSAKQQVALSLHRIRNLLVTQRTQLVSIIRDLLAEFGIDVRISASQKSLHLRSL